MPDVFLSYNREDQAVARRFADAFKAAGLDVWWDTTLRAGEAYDEVTETALREARAVVVLWSRKSVASRWVRAEATLADRNKTLVPAMIEPCDRPIMFELTQTADLTRWQGEATDRAWLAFLADVRGFVETRTAPSPRPEAKHDIALKPDAGPAKPAILILPFVNLSGDQEQEYFSDGVTEDIIADLGRVSALSVVTRNAAFALKGKTIAAAQLARDMKVSHILEGSVRKSGQRIRVTATLVEAARDAQVWAERFDRTLDDIFAIQDEISQAIVGALRVKLAPAERRAIEKRPTSNGEAYELFLMARQFDRRGSERMKPIVVRLCQRIVELDPDFAQAWAVMALAEVEQVQRAVEGVSLEHAQAAARRALDLAPDLAVAHAAMGETLSRGDSANDAMALPFIETALRLDPDCYEAHHFGGYMMINLGDFEAAIRHFEAAIALEPDAYRPAGMAVQCYQALGNDENTVAAVRRSLAVCERTLAVEPDHSGALGFFVNALADLGEADRARDWARRAQLFDPGNMRLHYNLACAMVGLKEFEMACDLLDGLIDKVNASWIGWVRKDNSLDPIRGYPRFVAQLERAGARLAREDDAGLSA